MTDEKINSASIELAAECPGDFQAQQTESLREQLAAAQAGEQSLLADIGAICGSANWLTANDLHLVHLGVQAIPRDTTALQQAITRAREEERERCAKVAENTATCLLPSGSFLSERCAAAIRALPAEPTAAECKCDLRTRLVGDGCSICNPERWADLLSDQDDDKKGDQFLPIGTVDRKRALEARVSEQIDQQIAKASADQADDKKGAA